MRITTNGILRNYRSSLMKSSNSLNNARTKVLTQRNFNTFAENPAGAAQAFQLRRAYSRTSDQLTNSTAVINKYESAWSSLDTMSTDIANAESKVSALRGLNDATGDGRNSLAAVLKQSAEAMMQNMNVSYGDSFIFAGADGLNVPFSLDGDGKLLYRGIDVSDPAQMETLNAMNEEATYIDIGTGLKEDADGNLITSSAFNSALSGIDVLGYGTDADGDPKNVISIIREISDIFARCDSETGEFSTDAAYANDEENANRLTDKLQKAMDAFNAKHTEIDTDASFLKTNSDRLEETADTLNEQILSIEQCDLSDAITSFSWAQYCYNAALKVGNSILSQSLIDYMN